MCDFVLGTKIGHLLTDNYKKPSLSF